MTKTKLLLTGLLAGAVVFGTACKTDTATRTSGTPQVGASSGAGGAGIETPEESRQEANPPPEEGKREKEPDVNEGTQDNPGTGGAGMETEPLDPGAEDEGGVISSQ